MIPRIAREVFRKDGIELLRDRRTIFVNVALPALLYPVLMLFALQVMQLTRLTADNLPHITTIAVSEELETAVRDLAAIPAPTQSPDGQPVDEAGDDALSGDEDGDAAPNALPPFRYRDLDPAQSAALAEAAEVLPLRTTLLEQLDGDVDDKRRKEINEQISSIEARLLELQRAADLIAVVLGGPPGRDGQQRISVLIDQAHRHAARVVPAIDTLLEDHATSVRQAQLAAANPILEAANAPILPEIALEVERIEAAPAAETLRARLAAIIPMLLVFMALSGAFYPALDLIAGERERGTLETLLSWPGDRRAIFTGKLLVVVVAAVVSVILNLASLGLTAALAGSGIAGGGAAAASLTDGLATGAGVLVLGFIALLPLIVTLSALSLALSGIAASYKEAQNYLSPLFLVVLAPAVVVMIPTVEPSWKLDIIPILGPLLSLKEALLSASLPLGHLALATGASTALAIVVVGWSVRLLDSERFLYPGLVRAGWGRFRKWGVGEPLPGGLEALGVFAAATGAFLLLGPQLQAFGPIVTVGGPLVIGILVPVLIHLWLGAYRPTTVLKLALPETGDWLRSLALIPLGIVLSLGIGMFQGAILGEPPDFSGMGDIFADIEAIGGLPLLIVLVAVLPAVCEEALLRGTVLTGLHRGLGIRSAVLVSAFCFAVLHASPWRFLPQFALGIVLALLVLRSGSVWTAILVHFGHNAGVVILGSILGDEPLHLAAWPALALAGVAAAGCSVLVWPTRTVQTPKAHAKTPGTAVDGAHAAASEDRVCDPPPPDQESSQ